MNEPQSNRERRLDELEAWIDGRLEGELLRGFEQELTRDPELARKAELAMRIEGALARNFSAPEMGAGIVDPGRRALAHSEGEVRTRERAQPRSVATGPATGPAAGPGGLVLRVAAMLGAAAALWFVLRIDGAPAPSTWDPGELTARPTLTARADDTVPSTLAGDGSVAAATHASVGPLVDADRDVPVTRIASPDLETLYSEATAWASDRSLSVCRPGTDLAGAFEASYGEGLELLPAGEGRLQGPFASSEWPTGLILAGYSEDAPAVLVAERESTLTCCLDLELPADSPLKVFTWRVGDLLLTEITPSTEPRLIDYFGELY